MFNQLEIISDEQSEKLYTIRRYIKNLDSACIAYSGGVDSTLVASLAFEQLGSKAIAITGISPALANTLRAEARSQAKWIGVKHLEIKTSELDQSNYSNNPKDRCFACKKELHKHTTYLSKKLNYKTVLDGVNLDDLKDYRPGIQASKQAGVISPLAKFKFSKKDIRDINLYRTFLQTEEEVLAQKAISKPPSLSASISFKEPSGNMFLDAMETGKFILNIENKGDGPGKGILVKVSPERKDQLNYNNNYIEEIAPGKKVSIEIPIEAYIGVADGDHTFRFDFDEINGFPPTPVELQFSTNVQLNPKLEKY